MPRSRRSDSNRLNSAASGLGTALGSLAGRVDSIRARQKAVATELQRVMASAQGMLADLGEEVSASAARVQRVGARKGKRRLSPEGRARVVAAAKKRWAKYHAEKRK